MKANLPGLTEQVFLLNGPVNDDRQLLRQQEEAEQEANPWVWIVVLRPLHVRHRRPDLTWTALFLSANERRTRGK